jgi:hypothetical protein
MRLKLFQPLQPHFNRARKFLMVHQVPGDTFRAAAAAQEVFTIGLWTILDSNLVFRCAQVYLVPGDTFYAAAAAQEVFTIGLWTILTQTSSLNARRCTWCLVAPSKPQLLLKKHLQSGSGLF